MEQACLLYALLHGVVLHRQDGTKRIALGILCYLLDSVALALLGRLLPQRILLDINGLYVGTAWSTVQSSSGISISLMIFLHLLVLSMFMYRIQKTHVRTASSLQ